MKKMMRKKRRKDKSVILKRKKRILREKVRLNKVVNGLGDNLTINQIHHATGMAEKTIRTVMKANPEEITFKLLTRNIKNGDKKAFL